MHKKYRRIKTAGRCIIGVAAVMSIALPVSGQTSGASASADRGFEPLMMYLAQAGEFENTAQPILDQIEKLNQAARDPQRSGAERLEKFNQARRQLRGLIDDPATVGHPLRPVWRTDLAEMLLVTHLEGFRRSAPGFVEFGVPTENQRLAFAQDVPIALAMLVQADQEFRDLESQLDRDTDLRQQLERSLADATLFDLYRDQRTAWFKAKAAYLTTLLPDDHPYFESLGATAGQAKSVEAERQRLLGVALSGLQPILAGDVGGEALRARAHSLAARVALAQDESGRAEANHLPAAVAGNAWNPDRLSASIAKARVAEQRGQAAVAETQLVSLAGKSAVIESLDYRLLVADALHLLRLRQAADATGSARQELVAQAYDVYFELLADPALGRNAGPLRNLIYDRWASSIPADLAAEALAELPPAVRVAVADISRRRGQLALSRGQEAAGRALLERAIDYGRSVSDRGLVGDEVWANGQYNLAYATYALEPTNLGSLLSAAETATTVAEETPTLPVATDAIDLASRLLESLHRSYAAQPGVTPAYERAMVVLYDSGHYDTTQPADDRLLYYAFAMFQAKGDYEQAAGLYAQQLKNHPNYFEAQAQRVAALLQWYQQTPPGSRRDQIESDLVDAAKRTAAQADPAMRNASEPRQADGAARALANARLALAQVRATRGDLDAALDGIADFETEFADRPALVQRGLERRILLLVDADRLEEAKEAAATMMGRFPDAAAGVINNVLSDMERQIEALGDDGPGAAKLADAAAAMAKLLADWAEDQGYDERQMLAYRLVVLKSLRIADRQGEALAYLRDTKLEANFGNNVDVLFEKARALVSQGDPASLREAIPLLNRIIGGLAEPYPDVYWRSWIARLEINLKLGEGVADVTRRVRQLQQTHPDLGGEPFKSRLEGLSVEAQRRR
ncbi:MAG: hypothetical protein AAF911_03835 [Planctomycetota bacterium]